MKQLKGVIKRYFTSLTFFYRFLRNKIFIAFVLSVAVSFLDGLGLTMFFPLLQVVGDGTTDNTSLGKLKIVLDAIEGAGIPLSLISVLIIMFIFFLIKGIAQYFSEAYVVTLQQAFNRKIRIKMLKGLNQMSFKKFVLSDVGRIQNTFAGEVERVSHAFNAYFKAFQQGVMVAIYMIFAFSVDWQFAILVSIGGGLTNFLYKRIYRFTKGESLALTKYNNLFQGEIIQHIAHFKYLRATGMVNAYEHRLLKTIFSVEKARRRIGLLASLASSAREPLLVGVIALVIFIQIKFFGSNIGAVLIALLFFYRALNSLVAMQQQWNTFMGVSGSLDNMQDFHKMLDQAHEKDGTVAFTHLKRGIKLQKVSFGYGETVILKNIDLFIPQKTSLAFVGESGSGKTTMVNLITGLFYADQGQVLLDDLDLKTIRRHSYQSRIGYVSQDAVIFNDTIYNNVTFWAPPTPENINRFNEAIEQASIKEFLEQLPEKEKTPLGNNGINLSGGQKQRISIARELYKNIDILILDEATSALDSETEKEIQESIDRLQGNYTIIIIAHRLATIQNADMVVLMNQGEIVDAGTFSELVDRQERFKKMVELQELK